MKKPLSLRSYLTNNFRRTVGILLALSLGIASVLIFDSISYGVTTSSQLGDVDVVERLTKLYPGDDPASYESSRNELTANPDVERLIPVRMEDMNFQHFFGIANVQCFFTAPEEISYLLEKMDLHLASGRLPADEKEIVLTGYLAANKGKTIGDTIGKVKDPTEKLPGEYTIVGILEGEMIVGFGIDNSGAPDGANYLAVPAPGKLASVNEAIRNYTDSSLYYWDLGKAQETDGSNKSRLNGIFDVFALAIMAMMAFGIGNASYAHYFSRRYEFGLLRSIGYTKNALLFRVIKEVTGIVVIGLLLGCVIGLGVNLYLKGVTFDARGYPFVLVQARGLLRMIAIPMASAVFAIVPSAWLLSNLDPMLVVEKNEG